MTAITETRKDEFFARVQDLLNEFPEISQRMRIAYEADPSSDRWACEDPDHDHNFNPDDPVMLNGIVLLLQFSNMGGWNDFHVMTPANQNYLLSLGMVTHARETW